MPPEPTVGTEYTWGRDPDDPTLPESWQVEFDFTALAEHRNPLAIHLDIGISHDLAGMAASHVDGWKDVQTQFVDDEGQLRERTVRKPVVVTDFVVAFDQVPGDPERDIPSSDIQIRWLRKLILELIARGWVVGMVTADGYQSTDTLQLLSQQGIETGLYSLDRTTEGYDTLKSMIMDQAVRAPFHPLLFAELESLTKVAANKVDHQAASSKDLADAWAGSVRGAVTLAERGGTLDDAWSGGNFEELAVTEVAPMKANRHGWMMSPTMTDHAEDHGFDGGGHDEWDLERQRFEEAIPERS